jgi:hypothetical protein
VKIHFLSFRLSLCVCRSVSVSVPPGCPRAVSACLSVCPVVPPRNGSATHPYTRTHTRQGNTAHAVHRGWDTSARRLASVCLCVTCVPRRTGHVASLPLNRRHQQDGPETTQRKPKRSAPTAADTRDGVNAQVRTEGGTQATTAGPIAATGQCGCHAHATHGPL